MFTVALYAVCAVLLGASLMRDRKKTGQALRKALRSFLNILPDFAAVLALVEVMIALLSPDLIARLIGQESGLWGMLLTSAVGAVTLIPGFVAFPLAASLLERGAGIMQIAVFVSTLMMVGVVTYPLESRYFGRKAAYWRNSLAYVFSFLVAAVIGVVVR